MVRRKYTHFSIYLPKLATLDIRNNKSNVVYCFPFTIRSQAVLSDAHTLKLFSALTYMYDIFFGDAGVV